MDPTDVDATITLIAAIGIIVGVFGVFIPVLPGLILCWLSVAVWAVFADGPGRWVVLAIATGIALGGTVVKYAWPGSRLKAAGVPNRSIFLGGLLGLIGFFVIPVFGLIIGFVLGIWLAERMRLHNGAAAWRSTKHALAATGLATLVELAAALGVAATWIVGLIVL